MLWYVMGCYGMLSYGMLWDVTKCYGMLWDIMGCDWTLWDVMGRKSESCVNRKFRPKSSYFR